MRNALVAAATGSIALALLVPIGGAAAAVPGRQVSPRECAKDNSPAAAMCRASQEVQGRLDPLMKGAHPGK